MNGGAWAAVPPNPVMAVLSVGFQTLIVYVSGAGVGVILHTDMYMYVQRQRTNSTAADSTTEPVKYLQSYSAGTHH